jgi:hypothetical protein
MCTLGDRTSSCRGREFYRIDKEAHLVSLRGLNLLGANASCDLHVQPGIPGGGGLTKQVKFELIDLKCNIVD